jgi:hypothetical protein
LPATRIRTSREHRHRRPGLGLLAAGLSAVLGAGLIAGCRNGDEPPAAGSDPPAAPTTSATPRVDLAGDEPAFPTTAQDYAELTVAAWAAPELFRLAELATAAVQREILALPGPPNRSWTSIDCQPAPAASRCGFYNDDGDQLIVTIATELLGQARAATEVAFDTTRYPGDPTGYVAEFVAAWQAGNRARMANLAVPEVVAAFNQLPTGDPAGDEAGDEVEYAVGERTDAITTIVVTVAGTEVMTRVNRSLLGQPRAIRATTPPA